MKIKLLVFMTVVMVFLAGCDRERTPEPNAATCAPGAFEETMRELRSEANRKAFSQECLSFHKAQKMRDWQFKPSPKDDF